MFLKNALATFCRYDQFKRLCKCVETLNLSDLQKVAKTFFKNEILSRESVPQGPFGRIKLYFEPEKRPAGAFWADQIVFRAGKASRRGLLGGSNYILQGYLDGSNLVLSQKSVPEGPQGPFRRIKFSFERFFK